MRGERARIRPEDHLADNPGQLSPGRPDLLTSPVERCRSRLARPSRGQRRKTPDQNLFTKTTRNPPEPLDAPLLTLVISSPLWGVSHVALRALELHGGRVILSGVYDATEAMSRT